MIVIKITYLTLVILLAEAQYPCNIVDGPDEDCNVRIYCIEKLDLKSISFPRYVRPKCPPSQNNYNEYMPKIHLRVTHVNNTSYSSRRYNIDHDIVELDLSSNLVLSDYTMISQFKSMPSLKIINYSYCQLEKAKIIFENEFPQLEYLDLSHNIISNFQYDTTDKQGNSMLKQLNISNNHLEFIPEGIFDQLYNLENLDLSFNFIDGLSIVTFDGLKLLHSLDLSHNRISDLNLSLLRFSQLESLFLDNNLLETLKERDFERLHSLKQISVKSNFIKHIDEHLFKNTKLLNILLLSDNQLELLYTSLFVNVTSLGTVDFSNNFIRNLPLNLFKGKNVSSFCIQGNRLQGSLEIGMLEGLTLLSELDLSHQNISGINDYAFYGMELLKVLTINNNSLENLSKYSLKYLKSLEYLDLSANKLSEITFVMSNMENLRTLLLQNNFIKSIKSQDLVGLSTLKTLHLNLNNITYIEAQSFKYLPGLIKFEISSNPLLGKLKTNSFFGLNTLPTLNISRSLLTIIENSSFSGMFALNKLDISKSQLCELQYNCFINTNSIEMLDISHNNLSVFYINSSSVMLIKYLYINNNNIKHLSPTMLRQWILLSTFNTSHNQIERFTDDMFDENSEIRQMDISYNPELKFNTTYVTKIKKLEILELSGTKSELQFYPAFGESITDMVVDYCSIILSKLHLEHLKKLKSISLRGNNITQIEIGLFSNLSNLEFIDLSYNKIFYIQPGIFLDNINLNVLILSHNCLSKISFGVFQSLDYLKTIDMSFNRIETLKNEHFYQIHSLNTLIVDHNHIRFINGEEFKYTGVTTLSIGDNPLSCECLLNFKKEGLLRITALHLNYSTENIDGVTCNKPLSRNDLSFNNFAQTSSMNNFPYNTSVYDVLINIRDIMLNQNSIKTDKKVNNEVKDSTNVIINASTSIREVLMNIRDMMNQTIIETGKVIHNDVKDTVQKNNTSFFELYNEEVNNTSDVLYKILAAIKAQTNKVYTKYLNVNNSRVTLSSNENFHEIEINKKLEELETKLNVLETIMNKKEASNSLQVKQEVKSTSPIKSNTNDAALSTPSLIFLETGISIILIIIFSYAFYKFLQHKGIFAISRTFSTHRITESIESANL